MKKTRDVFQHYRTVVYELTGNSLAGVGFGAVVVLLFHVVVVAVFLLLWCLGYRISVRGEVATLKSMYD